MARPRSREELTQPVIDAWNNPGRRPDIHAKFQAKLRREWPVLAQALDALAKAPAPRSFMAIDPELAEYLQAESKNLLDYDFADELGKAVYGEGRFVIGHNGRGWAPFPCAGYYPMELGTVGDRAERELGPQYDTNENLRRYREWISRKNGSPSQSSPSTP